MVEVVGVYDADGGVVGELSYVVGHLLGRTSCSLCDLTHGSVRRRPEWDAMVDRLPVPVRLVHRNEASDDERAAWSVSGLPAVSGSRDDGSRTVLLGPTGLARRSAGRCRRSSGRCSTPCRSAACRPGDAPPASSGLRDADRQPTSWAAGSTIAANRTPRPSEDEHREQPAALTARTGDQGDHGEGREPQRRGEEDDRRPGPGRREPRLTRAVQRARRDDSSLDLPASVPRRADSNSTSFPAVWPTARARATPAPAPTPRPRRRRPRR